MAKRWDARVDFDNPKTPEAATSARIYASNSAATTRSGPINKTLDPGPAAYSDLAVLPDGTILCLYEGKSEIQIARFDLGWITTP
jgi:sialidase-1